jgi:hypothetical protein
MEERERSEGQEGGREGEEQKKFQRNRTHLADVARDAQGISMFYDFQFNSFIECMEQAVS